MKNTPNTKAKQLQFAPAGKKRYVHYYALQRKNMIVRTIEIVGVIAIALIVIGGISGYFN